MPMNMARGQLGAGGGGANPVRGALGALGGMFGGRSKRPQPSVMGQQGNWVQPDDPNAQGDQMQEMQQPTGTLGDLVPPPQASFAPPSDNTGFAGGRNIADVLQTTQPTTNEPVEAPEENIGAVEAAQRAQQAQAAPPQTIPFNRPPGPEIVYGQQPGAPMRVPMRPMGMQQPQAAMARMAPRYGTLGQLTGGAPRRIPMGVRRNQGQSY